jgi:hypothetical protein
MLLLTAAFQFKMTRLEDVLEVPPYKSELGGNTQLNANTRGPQ